MKVFVVNGSYPYVDWIKNSEGVNNPDSANLIVFTGGADVDPAFYNEEKNKKTFINTNRDINEKKIFDKYAGKIPMLGICRGSQFLTVMNGGKLIQHVNNHAGMTHQISFNNGKTHRITSTHHQMMYPKDTNHELIAWSTTKRGTTYQNGHNKEIEGIDENFKEPEIVYYPDSNTLGIQGHPEHMPYGELHDELNDLILNKLF